MSTVIEAMQAEVTAAVAKYREMVFTIAEGKPVPRPTIDQTLDVAGKYPADLVADLKRATARYELAKSLAEIPALQTELDKLSEENQAAEAEIVAARKEFETRAAAAQNRVDALRPKIHKLLGQIGDRAKAKSTLLANTESDPEVIRLRRYNQPAALEARIATHLDWRTGVFPMVGGDHA